MVKTIQEVFRNSTLVFDGAMGTEIYRRHIFTNQCYDELNIKNSSLIREISEAYCQAGADVLTTNTYGANRFALERYGLGAQVEAINKAGVQIAKEASQKSPSTVYVAGSVGYPSKEILDQTPHDEVINVFAHQVQVLTQSGVDFVIFESQPSRDSAEIMVRAVEKSGVSIPFIISYGLDVQLYQSPHSLESRTQYYSTLFEKFAGVKNQPFAWGLNCILGPSEMLDAVQEVVKMLKLPLVVQPNAGSPKAFEGRLLYYSSPEYLAAYAMRYVDLGAAAVGGCCGTTPEEIAEIVKRVKPTTRSRRAQVILLDAVPSVKKQEEAPIESRSKLANKLCSGQWVQTVEAIPPCGYDLSDFISKSQTLKKAGVDAVNLPDGPRASARISSIIAAQRVLEVAKIEPVLHVCTRDRNLIALQADLIGCAAIGVNNLLFITGDPPKLGNYPNATGVFDCDAIGLCSLQARLNKGIDLGGKSILPPTKAFFGVGFDPSAINRDQEIERLKRKIEAGALFAVTQPVFDPDVLLSFLDACNEVKIPVIAGVWPFVSYRNALFMRKEVPGVVVPDSIMDRMEKASAGTKEDQIAVGIDIARESLDRLRPYIQGVQVSAPLGRIDVSLRTLGLQP